MSTPSDYEMPITVKRFSVVLAFVLGAGYAFGPDSVSSAPVFEYCKALLPIPVWGFLFMMGGFVLASTKFLGYAACGCIWLAWETLLILGSHDGQLQSWGGVVWPAYFVLINFMHIYQWGISRRLIVRDENITGYWHARRRSREEDR